MLTNEIKIMIINTELERKGNQFPNKIIAFEKDVDTMLFTTENNTLLQLTVIRDSVLRFRYATNSNFDNDFSYAIAEDYTRGYNFLETHEDDKCYTITTSKLRCQIRKEDARVKIYDAKDDTLINEDDWGFHWEEHYEYGGNIVKMSKITQDGESFYGLGDKPVHVNLRGKRFENWVTDSYAFGKDTDPIYKTIPFFMGLHHKKSYGIFFDNTFRSFFDFGTCIWNSLYRFSRSSKAQNPDRTSPTEVAYMGVFTSSVLLFPRCSLGYPILASIPVMYSNNCLIPLNWLPPPVRTIPPASFPSKPLVMISL